jgi:4-carboxymuconolactone decarboxylase
MVRKEGAVARVKLIQNREDVSPDRYALFDQLAALRGRISGPSTIVLHSPGLALPWNEISEYLHRESIVQAKFAELAVCATAREYDCAYIWAAHVPAARRAGIGDGAIAAVRDRAGVDSLPDDEATVVRYVEQLLRTNRVDDEVFQALLQAHSARWLVELTVWIGRYGALAGILNSFEVSPASDAEYLPEMPRDASVPAAAGSRPLGAAPRLAPITERESVADGDRATFDAVAEGRGNVRGPFALLMYAPPLCGRVFDVSNYLRFESSLSPAMRELATIATAREKDCPYVWAAHAPAARREGVSDQTIAAVGNREDVEALAESDRDIVDYTRQILQAHRTSQALFDRLRDQHGVPWLVELTALIGHYGMVTNLLNAVEVSPAPDAERLP